MGSLLPVVEACRVARLPKWFGRRRPKQEAVETPPDIPFYARHVAWGIVLGVLAVLAVGRLFWFVLGPLSAMGAMGFAILLLIHSFSEKHNAILDAFAPLPLARFYLSYGGLRFVRRKTFFVREGRVVGSKTRVERENQRPGYGVVIVDGASAAVFRDEREGGVFIAGPGITWLGPQHTLIATIALRSFVVACGGNPWSSENPVVGLDVRASLSGGQVAARLVGIFGLISPQDLDPPAWYSWYQEQAVARKQDVPGFSAEAAQRERARFQRDAFHTIFHGHKWSAKAFAEFMLTEALVQSADAEADQVPELFSSARQWFQELLAQAWRQEMEDGVREVTRLFQPIAPGARQRWIDEVLRALRERFTQPAYTPVGKPRSEKRRSEEYWLLRRAGLKAIAVAMPAVYLPPQMEKSRAATIYEPLWALVASLQGRHVRAERSAWAEEARLDARLTWLDYMARQYVERFSGQRPLKLLEEDHQPEALARLMLVLNQGTLQWLRDEQAFDEAGDPRLEHLRQLNRWLIWWRQNQEGRP